MDVPTTVKQTIISVLQIKDEIQRLNENTPLLGAIPELDSMAVVNILTALEEQCGIVFEDEEVTAELFETIGSLCSIVEQKLKYSI